MGGLLGDLVYATAVLDRAIFVVSAAPDLHRRILCMVAATHTGSLALSVLIPGKQCISDKI